MSVVDYYVDEDPSVYENDSCGLAVGCDLPAGFSGNEGNRYLRVILPWGGLGTAQLDLMMRNLTRTVSQIACSSSRAIQAQQTSLDSLA